MQVKAESDATKVERLNLQFDGAQSTNADLQRQNDELKRANADLKRQMDRWQNLETKGGEEVEALRKRNIDLEVSAKSLEDRLAKKESELQKEKKKVLKFKENVDEFEVSIYRLLSICSHAISFLAAVRCGQQERDRRSHDRTLQSE